MQRQWDRYFLSSVMFDLGSSDLSCSPEGFLPSYHLVTAPFFAKDVTRISPIVFFFFFVCVPFLPLKRFFECNVSLAYFEWCSFKVKAEKKTESEARGMKMWAQQKWEEGKIKVSGRQTSRKVAKEVRWWAGALLAKDNGQYEQRDGGSSLSIILSPSSDPVGTPRTW